MGYLNDTRTFEEIMKGLLDGGPTTSKLPEGDDEPDADDE